MMSGGGVGMSMGKVETFLVSGAPLEPDMRQRAIEAVALAQSNLIAKGATAYIIGVAINKDGHDYWQLRKSGPCLSTMALTAELREWCEESCNKLSPRISTAKAWWKLWRYRPI